ncbi:MAG: hypothetical protein Q4E69_05630, partial [Bacilli bacterium]|nr:hypothetical protein [Bacilli bacterium]
EKEETEETEENQPLIPIEEEKVETDNKEEEVSEPLIPIEENTDLENVSIETNESTEEAEEQILEDVKEQEDEIHFDESFNTDEVPEMEIVNEENDGMDLPNVVEADKIDYSAIDEEENKEEITNDEIVEIPNKKHEDVEVNVEDKANISYVGKEDSESPKAIIVTESQFGKLNESLEKQENKLYSRGYLSSELVNNSNYVLENSIKSTEDVHYNQLDDMVNEDLYTIPENPTREDMEGLIEKAAELYKTGKKHEAQALYEEISRINDEMHSDKGPELIKAA